jgi:hypothetical protein
VFSDQNCLTISEHLQLMVTGPLERLRLEQESLLQVLELCWQLNKQRLILRMPEFRTPTFRTLELHKLVRSILVRKDHILASDSSALEASTSASSA